MRGGRSAESRGHVGRFTDRQERALSSEARVDVIVSHTFRCDPCVGVRVRVRVSTVKLSDLDSTHEC